MKNISFVPLATAVILGSFAPVTASSQTLYVPGSVGTSTNSSVGVGVSNPAYKFTVNAVAGDGLQVGNGNTTTLRILSYSGVNLTDVPGSTAGMQLIGPANAHVVLDIPGNDGNDGFYVRVPTTLQLNPTVDKTALVVKSDGKIGLNTASPATRLSLVSADADFSTGFSLGRSQTGNGKYVLTNSDNNVFRIAYASNSGTAHADYTNRFVIDSTGRVGIGTVTPTTQLTVGKTAGDAVLRLENTGNGNSSGIDFVRERQSGPGVHGGSIFLDSDTSSNNALLYLQAQTASANSGFTGALGANNGVRLVLRGGTGAATFDYGNVGIGITNPTQKLEVNGTIRAQEVVIEASPWPDYVFTSNYTLPSLTEVAAHIEAEGHLPGVPSAATVAEHGVPVGEMQATLLRKVEEMTLYMIQLERKNAELESRLHKLEAGQ